MADWYYTKDGQQHGPVSEDELISIFRNNELDADALVWTEELTEWTAARNIENLIPEKPPEAIKPKFKITGVSHPSAASGGTKSCPSCGAAAKSDAVLCTMCGLNFLSGRKTVPAPIEMRDGIAGRRSNDNGVGLRINVPIWLMIAVPVVGAIIEYFSKLDLPWMFYFLAYAVPCLIDQRLLKKSGNDAPGSAWVFLVPVYLWKRTTLLSYRGRLHFWAWISSFLLAIGVGYYADQVSQVDKTEKTAGSLVTDILSEQLGADAKCVNVRLGKKDTNGVFTAVAKLTDGNTADITVEVKGDQVEVNVEIIRYLVFLKQTAAKNQDEAQAEQVRKMIMTHSRNVVNRLIAAVTKDAKPPIDASAAVEEVLSYKGMLWGLRAKLFRDCGDTGPDEAISLYGQGVNACTRKKYKQAMEFYAQAIEKDAGNAWAFNNLAWILATCPNKELRNGPKACDLAKAAIEAVGNEYWGFTETLAAAYAEKGDFDKAVEWGKRSLASTPPEDQQEAQEYLARFINRETVTDTSSPPGTLEASEEK